jgi:hypothetical protein
MWKQAERQTTQGGRRDVCSQKEMSTGCGQEKLGKGVCTMSNYLSCPRLHAWIVRGAILR